MLTCGMLDQLTLPGALALNIIAVSGSLRAGSINTALLRAGAALVPAGVQLTLFDGVASLPHFNPDVAHPAPPAVALWRDLLASADALRIASPEYAHGVPGAFKNALDWVVGCTGLDKLPVALINTSARATHAQAALSEIITTMDWHIVASASVTIPVAGALHAIGEEGLEAQFAQPSQCALAALSHAAQVRRAALRPAIAHPDQT